MESSNKKVWIAVFLGFLAVIILILLTSDSFTPKAAVIHVSGEIGYDSNYASPESLRVDVEKAEKDPSVRALVFLINSPGGSVVASREMARMVDAVEKPTVCWLADIAASGAYWIASSCDYIVADELSLTGSIGVTSSYLEFTGFMEKYGIGYEQFTTGKFKDTGTPYRGLTAEEEKSIRESIEKVYDRFSQSVSEKRNVSIDKIKALEGKAILGEEAKALGLVDTLGGREEVLRVVKEKTKEEVELQFYAKGNELEALLDYLPRGDRGLAIPGPLALLHEP